MHIAVQMIYRKELKIKKDRPFILKVTSFTVWSLDVWLVMATRILCASYPIVSVLEKTRRSCTSNMEQQVEGFAKLGLINLQGNCHRKFPQLLHDPEG